MDMDGSGIFHYREGDVDGLHDGEGTGETW